MKQVEFRNIDKLFIKMSINDKFYVIFGICLLAISCISLNQYFKSIEQIEQASIELLNEKLSSTVAALALTDNLEQVSAMGIDVSQQPLQNSRNHDQLTVVVETDGQFYSMTQSVSNKEDIAKKAALYSLLLTYLWLIPLAIALYYISSFIGGALYTLWDTTKNIAKGDLTSRLGFYPGRDEFGTIACALDDAMDTLTELIATVNKSASTLHTTSSSFADETKQSSEQIDQQYLSLDSVATAMEEMSASALEVSTIANTATHQVQQDTEHTKASYERVRDAIKEIEQLSTFIQATSNSVVSLKQNATMITDVITTINSISEQTNLLALNAAIEAARAGEMGRGFAVVADEVRTLAGRTQSATVEIQSMIEQLQTETQNIDTITSNTVKQANTSSELIANIGSDVNSIAESARSIMDMSFQISTSSEEQSSVANDIAKELTDIRAKSNAIKDLVGQSAQGVVELSEASADLGNILNRYKTVK